MWRLRIQRRCPRLVVAADGFQDSHVCPLHGGTDAEVAQVCARVVDRSSLKFAHRLSPHGHSIVHAASDHATLCLTFFLAPLLPMLRVSLYAPNFVSPSVSVCGVGGRTTISCWLEHGHPGCGRTKTSSTSTVDKVGRPASENRSSRSRIHSPRPESEKVHVEVRRVGQKAFSMV